MAIILSLAGAAIAGLAADSPLAGRGTLGVTNGPARGDFATPPENPLVGRGTLGVTNAGSVDSRGDPRIGRGTLGVVTNQFETNLIPELTNGFGPTNVVGATNALAAATNVFGVTNTPPRLGRTLSPGNPVLSPPGQPLAPGNPILSPPTTRTPPGSPAPPPKR